MRAYSRARDRGTALVITLAILVIISILAVGVADSVRMERSSSSSHAERARALLFAQTGVERVVAKLQKNTADAERLWLSQPGQLVVGAEQDDGIASNGDLRKILTDAEDNPDPEPTEARIVYLHSGLATLPFPDSPVLSPPNLNAPTFLEPGSSLIIDRLDPITGNAEEMRVRWIYVRKDGTTDTDEILDLNNQTNPIVGRYAYWADDESAKINYNLAWKKDDLDPWASKLSPGHPSRISLAVLDGFSAAPVLADVLHGFITGDNYSTLNRHLFNSPEDGRQASIDVGAALQQSKFEVTHYNHDPDTTFFNEPRIVLTTQESRAAGRPYLKVLVDETDDPGLRSNLDEAKLNETLFGPGGTYDEPKSPGLVYYMSRKDWPMVAGSSSLQDKYYAGDTTQLIQFAINIIDYVRSAESSLPIVEQIRGIPCPPKEFLEPPYEYDGLFKAEWNTAYTTYPIIKGGIAGAESTFKGLVRQPLITEMGILVSNTGGTNCRFFVEFHLPLNYGLDWVDLSELGMYFQMRKEGVNFRDFASIQTTPIAGSNFVDGSTILRKGEYRVFSRAIGVSPRPFTGERVDLRAVLIRKTAPFVRLEMVPVADCRSTWNPRAMGTQFIVPTLLPTTAALLAAPPPSPSIQTDDPRVSGIGTDWQQKTATWGFENAVRPFVDLQPQQDTTKTGKIVGADPQSREASLYMPAPKGSAKNPDGIVSSVGELGFIHTGMQVTSQESPFTDPPTPKPPGVPWRTIRLQPNSGAATVVPDWAFMDLFTVPGAVPGTAKSFFTPHGSATGGRINLNSKAEPFGLARTLPLAAVFQDARKDSTDPSAKVSAIQASEIAQNVYDRVLADGGKQYGYQQGYDSPGEVVEVKGVADGGEASEELIRQTSNLITSRGNVFTVYSIGQAMKQTPDGGLLVMAEQRRQTMIERYLDPASKMVRFGAVYTRQLTP